MKNPVIVAVIIAISFMVAYVLYNPARSGTGQKIGGGSDTTSATTTASATRAITPLAASPPPIITSASVSSSGSPIPIQVVYSSQSAIVLRSDVLSPSDSTRYGYFLFTLYADENLETDYINTLGGVSTPVYVKLRDYELRNSGYVWIIQPDFEYNRAYWVKIEETNNIMATSLYLGKVSFTTPLRIDTSDLAADEKIEQDLENFYNFLISLGAGIGLGIAVQYLILDGKGNYTRASEFIKEKIKKFPDFTRSLKGTRVNFMKNVSLKFNMYLNLINFSFEDIVNIARYLPNTIKRLAKLKISMGAALGAIDDILRTISVVAAGKLTTQAVQNLARRLGNAFINSVAASGRIVGNLVVSQINPIDVVLLGVGIAGMVLDAENVNGMADWQYLKTSDFLAAKEESIDKLVNTLKKHNITMIPAVNGPFFKYSNREIDNKLYDLEVELLLLPKYRSVNEIPPVSVIPGKIAILQTLSETGYIDTDADLNYIETQQVMTDLRQIQDTWLTNFVNAKRQSLGNTRTSRILEISTAETFARDPILSSKLNQIAAYILCKMEGGTPLRDGQCSYRTASECFNSYPWPMITPSGFDDAFEAVDPDSPCPMYPESNQNVSPCLSNIADVGITDFFYSEWRDPKGLERDFRKYNVGSNPIWSDPEVNKQGGACVVYPEAVRLACEASTKWSDDFNTAKTQIYNFDTGRTDTRTTVTPLVTPFLGKNDYNVYTGECTNTREFCQAYRVNYTDSMAVEDMAYRGSGPLPSCYWSDGDKAVSILFGGDQIAQGFREMANFFRESFRTWISMLNGDYEAELEAQRQEMIRVAAAQALNTARSDPVQSQIFDQYYNFRYAYSDTVSIVDFKISEYDGSMYVLYAYGQRDGSLLIRKFNKFFKPATNNWWSNMSNNIFGFKGPLENVRMSKIALDSDGSLYMIENIPNQLGEFDQKITKRDRDSGLEKLGQWTVITPKSLFNTGWPLNSIGTHVVKGEFNSIFIRKDNLYVIYSGYDNTDNQNIFKLYKFTNITTNSRSPPIDVFQNVLDFIGKDLQSEEIFSFIVDDYENLYSLFLNMQRGSTRGTGYLSKYSANNVKTTIRLDTFTPSTFYDYDSRFSELAQWPTMCIDDYNNIFVTNGLSMLHVNSSREVTNLETIGRFKDDLFSNIYYSKIFPWECSIIAVNNNNEICTINRRYDFINWGYSNTLINYPSRASIIFNRMEPSAIPDKLIKFFTVGSIEAGVDYIFFKNLTFNSNCVGYEPVDLFLWPSSSLGSVTATPSMLVPYNYQTLPGYPVDMLFNNYEKRRSTVHQIKSAMAIRNTPTTAPLPLVADSFRMVPNTTYVTFVYLENKFMYSNPSIILNTIPFRIDPVNVNPPSEEFPYRDGGAYKDTITFTNALVVYGSRVVTLSGGISGLPAKALAGDLGIVLRDSDGDSVTGILWKGSYNLTFTIPGTNIETTTSFIGSALPGTPDLYEGGLDTICYREGGTGNALLETCETGYSCPNNGNVARHEAKCERD